jgi:hypothetical protein
MSLQLAACPNGAAGQLPQMRLRLVLWTHQREGETIIRENIPYLANKNTIFLFVGPRYLVILLRCSLAIRGDVFLTYRLVKETKGMLRAGDKRRGQ